MSEAKQTKRNGLRLSEQQLKDRKRHIKVFDVLRKPVHFIIHAAFDLHGEDIPIVEGNSLVLFNHNTDFDCIFAALCCPKHMYFVASEHILSVGPVSWLLNYFLAPITRVKGTTATTTALQVMRTLRSGSDVCIFAEGNRSFNGVTCPILFSTGKLAKATKSNLITMRFEGGYFASPRWSYSMRRGRIESRCVNVYTPEMLANMTDDEVNEAIKNDLYEDAYKRQRSEMIPYRGSRLAEGLEHVLYVCPECERIGTMHSKGNRLYCDCGMKLSYDKFGFLHGTRFDNVYDWDMWQIEKLHEYIDSKQPDEVLFEDDKVRLLRVDEKHNRNKLAFGKLTMTGSELIIGDYRFKIEGIPLGIYGRCSMVFERDGTQYELKSKTRLCSTKYQEAYSYILGKAKN